MKIEHGARPNVAARHASGGADLSARRRPPWRRAGAIVAGIALALMAAFAARHAIVGFILTRGVGAVTGYRMEFGDFHIGLTGTVFSNVRVTTRAGDPLIQAQRVTARYSLAALRAGTRRFGLWQLELDRPVFSIVRHADGSYNLAPVSAPATAESGGSAVPWDLDVEVRDGEMRLIDATPAGPDLAEQRVVGITLVGRIRSVEGSTADLRARFVSRQNQTGALRDWPMTVRATIDYPRGIAILHAVAEQLPIRGILGFLAHGRAVRVDDGILRAVDLHVYALDVRPDRPLALHAGGSAELADGQLAVSALARPARDVRGQITLVDDGVWARRLDATLAGIPIAARGGVFDRSRPTLRLGIWADGDLRDLRRAFAFSQRQPVAGPFHAETLLEAPVSELLVRSSLRVTRGSYAGATVTDVGGRIDYHAGAIVLDGVAGQYGGSRIGVGGRFLLGGRALDSAVVAAASAPGRAIPFGENLAPEARIDAIGLLTGGPAGFRVRGTLGVGGRAIRGHAAFAVNERGVGDIGPIVIERDDGSSVVGGLRLERPTSQSAGWISARGYHVDVPGAGAVFPGVHVPAFPPVAGVIDGELAGGGTPDAFAVIGSLRGTGLAVGAARLGAGRVLLSGSLRDLRLARLTVDGPLGRFAGSGAVAGGAFALRGAYDGSLERLVPLTGNQGGHGAVRGEVLAALRGPDALVQSPAATLRGASVRGVDVDAVAGTIDVRNKTVRVIAASGAVGGRHAVAAESGGRIAISAPDLPSAALRGAGLPLEAGNVSAYGVADLRQGSPIFAGTVAVADGLALGYRVAGDAQIDLNRSQARIYAATGAFGSTYGGLGGTISDIGRGPLRYDLDARVGLGDIDALRRDLKLPVRNLAGTFGAQLHLHGSGTRPLVDGRVEAPEGMYNGLAFRGGGARIVIDRFGVAARDGTLTVGSTTTAIAASAGGGGFSVAAHSAAADLADFDDYFDASDTLAGQGAFNVSARTSGNRIVSTGAVTMDGLHYCNFALGQARAHWHTRGTVIAGTASISGVAGTIDAVAAVTPGAGRDPRRAFRTAHYDARARFRQIDIGRWVIAAGSSAPISGRLDAQAGLTGRYPDLAATLDASLTDGRAAGYAIHAAHLRGASRGSRIDVLSSTADLGFAQLAGQGQLGLGASDPLNFNLSIVTDDVGRAARAFIPAARNLDLGGALDADVRLGGTRGSPDIAGGFDLRGARYGTFVVPRAIGELALRGKAIELRDADVEFAQGQAFVAGSLPLVVQPFGLGPPAAPLSFDVTARDVDLSQFDPLLPAGTALGGLVDGRFGVEGTVDRPRLLGSLTVAGGSYASHFERAPIEHIQGNVVFSGSSIAVQAFHADVGGGTLDGSGRITLPIGAQSGVSYRVGLTAQAAKLDFPAYGRGTIDAALALTGSGSRPLVDGKIALRDALIPVSAVYGGTPATTGATGNSGFPIDPAFHVQATAGQNVRVRSSIVDIGVTGAVDLTGTLRAPMLDGGFTATDGTISSYNHVFKIVDASVTFNPADGAVPTIAARATSRVSNPDPDPSRNIAGSANIIVTVSGTADNHLQVTYSSEPAYSQEQIIGLLLDVPALLGAVNFDLNGGLGTPLLRGAPGETNALLPPGVTPEQVSAISFDQEVFSLLNGQITQRALTPVERVFEKGLGLSDVQFTADYSGGIGYSLRRDVGNHNLSAFLSQTVTYPERGNVGFEYEPKPFNSLDFSFYAQSGVTSLITNQTPGQEDFSSTTRRLTSVQPIGNRSGFSLTFNRRF